MRRLLVAFFAGTVAGLLVAVLVSGDDAAREIEIGEPAAVPPAEVMKVAGREVVAIPYQFVPGADPDAALSVAPPEGWNPADGLPTPWPENYLERDHPFAPWTFMVNAGQLCSYARLHPDDDRVRQLADELFERMLSYTEVDGDARFVVYRFEHQYEADLLQPGWVSGLGNGVVISGLVAMHECWQHPEHLEVAFELARAYEVLRRDTGPWFAFVTEDRFLWFEEVPTERPSMVLNGHIHAVAGLYYLWDETRDPQVLELLRAGVTSARAYVAEYRRPGQVNCYDLSPPCHADYGPRRTVRQQRALFEMTGDSRFDEWADVFQEDID